MAGDWIKIEHALPDKPEVMEIANAFGIDADAVVGKLIRVWTWFDIHTENGNANVTMTALLDRYTGVKGFVTEMQKVGWITESNGVLTINKFERHNGQTAKNRANTNRRVAKLRKCNDDSVTNVTTQALQKPLPEKRREEKILVLSKDNTELPFSSPDFLMFWSNWEQHRIEIKKKLTPTTKKQQLAKLGEMGEARAIAALKHSLAGGWQGIFEPQGAAATSTPTDEAVLLMGAIDSIRTSWQKIPWNNEDRAALIKYQEQLAALTDDDLQVLKAYFESTAEGYFRPDNRSKFCESLSGIWTACERWKKATGYRAPNSRDSLYYGS
jgi:hypothetical protein